MNTRTRYIIERIFEKLEYKENENMQKINMIQLI